MGLTTSIRNEPSNDSEPSRSAGGSAGSTAALLRAVQDLADTVLWPAATDVDRAARIPAGHLQALAELGLFGMGIRPADGGLGLPAPDAREVLRRLASGCGATAFSFAQHHGTTASVAATSNDQLRRRWLPALVDDQLAGIAYAHVRRSGPPVLVARRDGAGWLLEGTAPWVTSWGSAAVLGVAAIAEDGRLLWALVPAVEAPGVAVGGRLELMVYQATATVALAFDRYRVGPESVLSVLELEPWAARDRLLAARPNPLCMGVGDRALACLAERAPDEAVGYRSWWDEVVGRAEAACAAVDGGEADVADVSAARDEVLAAVQRLTTALLAATGGRAMQRSDPAQRLAREALFYVIQAQNADGRAATLDRLRPDEA